MIAIDANVLVYAHRQDSEWHEPAAECLRSCAEGRAPWALPWPCVHEFLAIVTHPRIFSPPTTTARAIDQIDAWMDSPSVVLLAEGATHWTELRGLLEAGRVSGPQVHDARVAALCLAHGVRELWTADRDFSRFPALRTRNPLTRA
ncbi:MAG TPA: TA system VapC family ribonuclease toxin [Candidatus Binatia bacterium]|nr:TA system VapC family ribonuclease toxin [Candidatus Binatia bacterium]